MAHRLNVTVHLPQAGRDYYSANNISLKPENLMQNKIPSHSAGKEVGRGGGGEGGDTLNMNRTK